MVRLKDQAQKNFDWIILILAPFFFFFGPLMGTDIFYFRDILTEEIPNQIWIRENIGSLWNPGLFTGQPHFANPQAYGFEPLHVFSMIFPGALGFNFFVVSHFWVASIGFFYLMRAWGFSRLESLAAGLVFTYGGCFISMGYLPILLGTTTYLPWALLMLTQSVSSAEKPRQILYGLFLAIVFCFQILAGEPQIFLMTVFLCLLDAAVYFPTKKKQAVLTLVPALALGILMASVQWIPFLEFLAYSNRQATLTYDALTQWSLYPSTILSLLIPHYIADPAKVGAFGLGYWESRMPYFLSLHVGIVAFTSICLAGRKLFEKRHWVWVVLFLSGIFLALGKHNPIFEWLTQHIPGLNAFRFPEKYFIFSHVSLSVLSGLGFRWALQWRSDRRWLWLTSGTFCAWLILGPHIIEHLFEQTNPLSFWRRYFFSQVAQSMVFVILFLMLTQLKKQMRGFALSALILCELFWVHRYVNPTMSMLTYLQSPHAAFWLRHFDGVSRFASMHSANEKEAMIARNDSLPTFYLRARERLSPPTAIEFGLFDINAVYSLYHQSKDFFMDLYLRDPIKTLQILGVKTIVASYPIERPDLKPMFVTDQEIPIHIYRYKHFLPPAYLVNQWQSAQGLNAEMLLNPDFDPRVSAFVESPAPLPPTQHTGKPFSYRFLETFLQNDYNRFQVYTEQRALFILQQTHYPGWRVFLNGKETGVHKVNGIFQGLWLEPGQHLVTFQFMPKSFYHGAMISILAWTVVLVAAGWIATRKDYFGFFRDP